MFIQQLLCAKPDKSVLLPFSLVLHTPEVDLLFVEIIRSDSKLPAVLITPANLGEVKGTKHSHVCVMMYIQPVSLVSRPISERFFLS